MAIPKAWVRTPADASSVSEFGARVYTTAVLLSVVGVCTLRAAVCVGRTWLAGGIVSTYRLPDRLSRFRRCFEISEPSLVFPLRGFVSPAVLFFSAAARYSASSLITEKGPNPVRGLNHWRTPEGNTRSRSDDA